MGISDSYLGEPEDHDEDLVAFFRLLIEIDQSQKKKTSLEDLANRTEKT